MVVGQRPKQEVGQRCNGAKEPCKTHTQTGVAMCVVALVVQCVLDITVTIDGNGCDVEDGANDPEAQNEDAQLAQRPIPMEDGQHGQGLRIQRHHQVIHRKAYNKDITWPKKYKS